MLQRLNISGSCIGMLTFLAVIGKSQKACCMYQLGELCRYRVATLVGLHIGFHEWLIAKGHCVLPWENKKRNARKHHAFCNRCDDPEGPNQCNPTHSQFLESSSNTTLLKNQSHF